MKNWIWLVVVAVGAGLSPIELPGQTDFSLSEAKEIVEADSGVRASVKDPWWRKTIVESLDPKAERIETDLALLLQMAMEHSAKISVARHLSEIRQTSVTEALADFDWTSFVDSNWKDASDPVGSSLTVGGTGSRFRDHHLTVDAGLKRKLQSGGTIDLTQKIGHQDTNSNFFIPANQATSRIVLGFTQPLLQGNGRQYNTSLITIANIDVDSANEEFRRQLQTHLMEVTRGYWSLYLERASLAQKIRLYRRTREIHDQIKARLKIDAQRSQYAAVSAALESRRSDLIRAIASVKNAETKIRSLVNLEQWHRPDMLEFIPVEHPTTLELKSSLPDEIETAFANRPEIRSALNSIHSASIRLDLAQNEILPKLNLVMQTYVAGLRGNSDLGNAFLDQFRVGEPGYSIGLQYEMALGRRAARARATRRELEISQLQEEYRNTLELVRAEVEVAYRELNTSYRELIAKNRAREAAEQEAKTLEVRWRNQVDRVAAGLTLESLLQSQQRVSQAEFEFSKAQLTYNLAMINLRHATGTLLAIERFRDLPGDAVKTESGSSAPRKAIESDAVNSLPSLAPARDGELNPASGTDARMNTGQPAVNAQAQRFLGAEKSSRRSR